MGTQRSKVSESRQTSRYLLVFDDLMWLFQWFIRRHEYPTSYGKQRKQNTTVLSLLLMVETFNPETSIQGSFLISGSMDMSCRQGWNTSRVLTGFSEVSWMLTPFDESFGRCFSDRLRKVVQEPNRMRSQCTAEATEYDTCFKFQKV